MTRDWASNSLGSFLTLIPSLSTRRFANYLWVMALAGALGTLTALSHRCGADEPTAEQLQFFEAKIRPVLSEHCYACHSDQAAAEGKLRGELKLDSRAAVLAGGESGPAIELNAEAGTLLSALRHEDYEMPPSGRLPDEVIADFAAWIEMGAPDPRAGGAPIVRPSIDLAAGRQHWSFRPLSSATSTEPSMGRPAGWPENYVDQWLGQAQRAKGIEPLPSTSARTLVRRVWFDLVGLPPTPDEIDHWTNRLTRDDSIGSIDFAAYGELVDHLLDHPGYGERWARHWMDVARFAESHGYEQDYDRPTAFHYRDFLIRAFNDDLPYDQFVKWQLAGDECEPNNPLAMMATGFLGAGAFPTQLTEAEFESARYDELDDMVSTVGVAFLGLSIGCARCHDHKYDPIPVEDYYHMASVFRTAIRSEVELDLDPPGNREKRDAYQARERELLERRQELVSDSLPAFRDWLATDESLAEAAGAWLVLGGSIESSAGTRYEPQGDGSLLATSAAPRGETLVVRAPLFAGQSLRSLRLETLADASLPHGGPGRAGNGNFALGDIRVAVKRGDTEVPLSISAARATHEQNDSSLSVAASIDDDRTSGWAIDGQIGKSQAAVFSFDDTWEAAENDELVVTLVFEHPNGMHVAGRLRTSVSGLAEAPVEVGASGPNVEIVRAVEKCRETDCQDEQALELALAWFATTRPAWQEADRQLAELRAAGPGIQLAKVLVTSEGLPHLSHHADGRGFPHFYPEVYQLRRGDVHQKVEVVPAGYLQVLIDESCDSSTWEQARDDSNRTSLRRRGLAEWMVDVDRGAGGLVARVMVNRLWQHHFGRGIVATSERLWCRRCRTHASRAARSTGEELIESNWSLKAMHRRILLSAAYARESRVESEVPAASIDPENTTLWRREPRRLEAEAIRDSMLSIGGQLDTRMYGPGTLDSNMKRRSVYFFIKRSQLIPMMMLFDWPEHLVSIGQRSSTTIAPQALMFMNSPQGRAMAGALAARLDTADDGQAIDEAYRLAFGRSPRDDERELGLEFLRRQAQRHVEAGHPHPAQSARVDYCQSLMSLNEFVYID
ncbi:MAG: PSD1 and planctomycete cytochrome C domain-containing protein [Pirellulaceae bacterium]